MSAAPEHDRLCVLANNALEVLIEKQRHAKACTQCRSDPDWCKQSKDFDDEFMRYFATWQANRQRGGVLSRD